MPGYLRLDSHVGKLLIGAPFLLGFSPQARHRNISQSRQRCYYGPTKIVQSRKA